MDEGRRARSEDEEESAREPTADRLELDERRGEEDDERLGQDVAPANVGELVRDQRLRAPPAASA